jgi:hypothetical protein
VLEVHERADRALGIGQRRAQPLALLGRKRLHHLFDHFRRQVRRDVGELVGLQGFGRGDELGGIHRCDERFAHRVGHFNQDLAVAVRLDEIPDLQALFRRQRLEDVGDIGRMQGVELCAQLGTQPAEPRALAQQRLNFAQVLLQVLDLEARLHRFGHGAECIKGSEPTLPGKGWC